MMEFNQETETCVFGLGGFRRGLICKKVPPSEISYWRYLHLINPDLTYSHKANSNLEYGNIYCIHRP